MIGVTIYSHGLTYYNKLYTYLIYICQQNKYQSRRVLIEKGSEMARSATFNWSQLTRENLIAMVRQAKSLIVGKRLSVNDLQKTLSKHLKSNLPIKVTKDTDWKTEKGWVYVGGFYHGDNDKLGRQSIEVVLSYNPSDKALEITKSRFDRLCVGIADTILHEIIHMRQYRSRRWKDLPGYSSVAASNKQRTEQNYLGHPDEIDAYAFNIACRLYHRWYSEKEMVEHLNLDHTDKRLRKDSYSMYLEAFDHKHSHPVIKKLKKRVMYYAPYAALGKPYKTTDWLKR